ncbi:hypothetical protein SORBI_3003G122900 [Sorghum bicolor]|uniref:SURP motif domain-containing protein n=1 Tax=Sorghum bicolor TaxID=4558 RepID=A0A1B6Q2S7_SORBI|nr:hypothetical protein SORBI_3003G122900 [Sorghum bicolor]
MSVPTRTKSGPDIHITDPPSLPPSHPRARSHGSLDSSSPLLPFMAAAMGTSIDDDQQLQEAPPKPPPPGAKADPPATVATHTRTIGIIHPPPDIRVIIEKAATFVVKNGPEFERRIISHNHGNAKFNFLQPSDPYHAYYQHRVFEIGAAPPGADAPSGAETDGDPAEAPASAPADGGAALAPADGAAEGRT